MRLTAKLVIAFVLVSVILMAVNGYLTMRRELQLRERQIANRSQGMAKWLEQFVVSAWETGNMPKVIQDVREINQRLTEWEIRWVWFDNRASRADRPYVSTARLRLIAADKIPCSIPHRTVEGNGFICTYYPITIGERPGGLELTSSTASLDRYKWWTFKMTAFYMGIMLLLSGIMVAVLGVNVVGRPLQLLIEKTRRAGDGDLSGDLEVGGNDELTELGHSLNDMCRQLQETQERVQAETTARIAALEQLRHVDRLQTVGRLASGIAHELGTPLNVVSGRAALLASGKLPPQDITESATTIKQEADRMANIIRQLLDFARRRTPNRVLIDLREIVEQTKELMNPLAQKHRISIEWDESSQPTTAYVDVGQLQQVLTNLIVNAVHAMPDSGTIHIAVGRRWAEPPSNENASVAEYDFIDVLDTGAGIPDDVIDHIFEPFFTTKDVGEGTGLGLSLSYGIIKEHGGWIAASSQPGQGSCFSVYLPPKEEEPCSDAS
mgnify:CR=1 FL=1